MTMTDNLFFFQVTVRVGSRLDPWMQTQHKENILTLLEKIHKKLWYQLKSHLQTQEAPEEHREHKEAGVSCKNQ